jgi:hypothetical protein
VSEADKPASNGGRRRRRRGGGQASGGDGGGQRRRNANAMYRRKMEEKLFGKKGDRARLRLVERLRESHGTPGFHRTFREYIKAHGLPEEVPLLVLLLDLEDERDVVKVLEGIDAVIESSSSDDRSLIRSRLRNLEMSTDSDSVADATASLLERL